MSSTKESPLKTKGLLSWCPTRINHNQSTWIEPKLNYMIHQSESSEKLIEIEIFVHFGGDSPPQQALLGHLEVRSITSLKLMSLKKEFQLEMGPLKQRENDTAMTSLTSILVVYCKKGYKNCFLIIRSVQRISSPTIGYFISLKKIFQQSHQRVFCHHALQVTICMWL